MPIVRTWNECEIAISMFGLTPTLAMFARAFSLKPLAIGYIRGLFSPQSLQYDAPRLIGELSKEFQISSDFSSFLRVAHIRENYLRAEEWS